MLDLKNFFKIVFDDPKISDESLRLFAVDTLQRMSANNSGGTLTTNITDTTNAYTNYFGAITDEDLKFSIQQGLTIAANNLFEGFKKDASRKEGAVRSQYGVDSATYQEFYPHGINEYTQATKENVLTLMTRLKNSFHNHVGDLGLANETLFTNYLTNYTAAANAQQLKFGEVSGSKTLTASNRHRLEAELQKDVLTVALQNVGNQDAAAVYFDQSLIRPTVNSDNDGKGKLQGLITELIGGVITPVEDITVKIIDGKINNAHSVADGGYRTQYVKVGIFQVEFSKPGYVTQTISIEIKDEGTTVLNVVMVRV